MLSGVCDFASYFDKVDFVYMPRKLNRTAHFLAKIGPKFVNEKVWND